MPFSRRDFLATTALGTLGVGLEAQQTKAKGSSRAATVEREAAPPLNPPKQPVMVCSANGHAYLDDGYGVLRKRGDTLDGCMAVIRGPEDDPNDDSVGYGGLPNEEGVVELDACCMHGPTRRAGAVAGVRTVKNVSLLSKAVMEQTGHVMLVGEGADRFAAALGFAKENLLSERSRRIWMLWKQTHSNQDWWGPGLADPNYKLPGAGTTSGQWERILERLERLAAELGIEPEHRLAAMRKVLYPPTGTIHCSAVNEKGEMSGATTTSGLAWKIPGRAGDSPIIGAGCFTDQDVGSAGATGNGEENIKVVGAFTIVENMRRGMSPQEAGLDALRRIQRNYGNDINKLRFINMTYYVLRKDGAYAGVSLWSGAPDRPRRFAVHDGQRRYENCVTLLQGTPVGWPPMPQLREEK